MKLPHNYTPREYQKPFWRAMLDGCKRAVLVWHRRAGKDKTVLNWTIFAAFQRVGAYYYFFPTYNQGRKALWDGRDYDGFRFLDHIPAELVKSKNETEMQIELVNGSIIQIIGTDRLDNVRGTNPVGCIFSEYAIQNPKAWEIVEPILLENGGWAAFAYTPLGRNHGYARFIKAKLNQNWYAQLLTVRDTKREDGTPVISEAQIDEIRADGTDEAIVQQEYYCSFSGAVQGSYFTKQLDQARAEGRIRAVPVEATLDVYTAWDLGVGDSTALWFYQQLGREVRIVDYYENSGEGLTHYAKILREKPYAYGAHGMPHDIEVRELTTGKSRKEIAERELKLRPIRVAKKLPLDDGIDAARRLFSRCYFDETNCEKGLAALAQYHREWDEEKQVFKNQPQHDWSSHGADAFRTLAMTFRDEPLVPRATQAETRFDPFTYDQPREYEREFSVFGG